MNSSKNKRTASTVAFICRSQKIHSSAMCHKTKDSVFTKNPILGADGGAGDDGGGGRISSNLQPPFPSRPGITYPVRAPALTPISLTPISIYPALLSAGIFHISYTPHSYQQGHFIFRIPITAISRYISSFIHPSLISALLNYLMN